MIHTIYANFSTSISELKKQPMSVINATHGEPIAILNHNEPVFYCVPREKYEAMMDALDDLKLAQIVKERESEIPFEVDINDL